MIIERGTRRAVEVKLVFAYNSKKGNFQSAAEGVAKNLKRHIEEP